MALSFTPVTLAASHGDSAAMLVFDGDRLLAVLSCLGDLHDELEGRWYPEVIFGEVDDPLRPTFESLAAFEAWIAGLPTNWGQHTN